MSLEEMKLDCAVKQKKGLHFILGSIIIWIAVLIIHLNNLPITTKNLFTFCCTAPLLPLAFLISKIIKVDFQNKENPLTNLGIIFSINQMIYLLIAMWIYNAMPDKMLMVLAMIFGAHLLPYGWLYNSKTYYALSVIISITALLVGCNYETYFVAIVMIIFEILFSVLLVNEVRKLNKS